MHIVYFAAWTVCLIVHVSCQERQSQEPICYSRFDYDHKVLTHLVTLETEQRKLEDTINQQSDVIKSLQTELADTKSHYDTTIQSMTTNIQLLDAGGSGSTYIRYGRTVCPENGTELVYSGYVGGSYYTETGGAVNYLCLPKDPIWGYYRDSDGGSNVHGAEYQLSGSDLPKFFGRGDLYDKDVPCAVCRAQRSSVMMVPARNKCHDGWTLEYHGYLTGGKSMHAAASEFTCLDVEPEVLQSGDDDKNGKLFYLVQAKCGSLKCPPYMEGRELTCAMCSK